jgi:hypothetical protein
MPPRQSFDSPYLFLPFAFIVFLMRENSSDINFVPVVVNSVNRRCAFCGGRVRGRQAGLRSNPAFRLSSKPY